jgi:hypothetical protein
MKIAIDMPETLVIHFAVRQADSIPPVAVVKMDAATLYAAGARASARFLNSLLKLNRGIVRKAARRDRRAAMALSLSMGPLNGGASSL